MSNTPPEDTAVLLKNSQFLVSRLTPSQRGAAWVVGISGDRACSVLDTYFHPFKDTSIDLLEVDSIAVGQWNHELLSGREGIGLSSKRAVKGWNVLFWFERGFTGGKSILMEVAQLFGL